MNTTIESVVKEAKHGVVIEETIDSRFVFQCAGQHLLERCPRIIDIPHSDVNIDGYKCPTCGETYLMDNTYVDTRGRRLLYSDEEDLPNDDPYFEEDTHDADLSDTNNE